MIGDIRCVVCRAVTPQPTHLRRWDNALDDELEADVCSGDCAKAWIDGAAEIDADADAVFAALAARHHAPEWVYLPQVRTRTGYSLLTGANLDSERYLDAFAMNCYRSKGYRRVGYEIKVSRSDWLRELADPLKRAQGYFLCHEFYFAFASGVYKPDDAHFVEIRGRRIISPLDGCGVIEVAEDGALTVVQRAVSHDAWPMPDTFVASLLRAYVTYVARRQAQDSLDGLLPSDSSNGETVAATTAATLWTASGE